MNDSTIIPTYNKKQSIRIVFVLVLLFALFFATYRLKESPSVWYDEGIYIQSAVNALETGGLGYQLSPGNITQISRVSVSYPLLFPLAEWFNLFGISIVSARSFMVIVLILLLIITYSLVRRIYGNIVALGAILLLATFPPLFGNGKSVLGEVPGLLYFISSLLCLTHSKSLIKNKTFWLIIGGLFLGLAAMTKPIFLLFVPAFLIGLFFEWKRRSMIFREIVIFMFSSAIPFIAWIFIQFVPGDTISSAISAFSSPYQIKDHFALFLNNLRSLFSDSTPLYLMFMMAIWSLAGLIRIKQKRLIPTEEIISFIFCLLIVVAYLRIVGAYRYIFPAQILAIIFLIPSLFVIVEWSKKNISRFGKYAYHLSVLLIGFLVVGGVYGLCSNSWVANSYNSHKTAFWQDYFRDESPSISYFFYDTPEVTIFDKNKNYYQYIIPNNWPFSTKELEIINDGIVDRIVIQTNAYKENTDRFKEHYHPVLEAYKYTILSKNQN